MPWQPNVSYRLLAFSLFFFLVFCSLGIWQIDRGGEKEAQLRMDAERRQSPGVALTEVDMKDPQGVSVILNGSYQPGTQFLLDNKVLEGRVGFEVLVPFLQRNGTNVLVNRGFIPMGRTREDTPSVPPLVPAALAHGHIYVDEMVAPEVHFISGETSPFVVQTGDPELIGDSMGKVFYPYVVRLSEDDPNALPRYWPVTTMGPERHYGYALTWFLMAFAVCIAFAFTTFKSSGMEKTSENHE